MSQKEIEDNDLNKIISNAQASFKERRDYDKLSFFYISLPVMLSGNLLGVLLLSAIQIYVVDLYPIGIWLLVNIIMFIYQSYHYHKFKSETEENKLKYADIWLDKYYTNILIGGIIWGSSAFLLFPETGLINQMIVILFLFAIGFASMGILASKSDLLLTYGLATYSPILLRLFFMEDELYTRIAYVVLALMLIIILIANYYGKIINNALEDRQHFILMKHTHEKLKERFLSLFENAPVGIYYYNEDLELEDINTHFRQMNKAESKEELIGINLHTLNNKNIINEHQTVFEGKTGSYRGPFVMQDNENIYVKLSTVPMINNDNIIVGGISIINDITNEVLATEKMLRNTYYDSLTNIPNRTLLMDKLKDFISNKRNDKEYAALFFITIDNIKKINEVLGYDIGDNLLKQVVQRVEDFKDNHEIFARVGGDKFVIFSPSLHINKELSEEMATKYTSAIEDYFTDPFNIANEEYYLSFTVSNTLFNDGTISAFNLLQQSGKDTV